MRFLVIGTNFISDLFADALSRLTAAGTDAEIGAVLSRRGETASAFARRNGVDAPWASTLDEAFALYRGGAFDAAYVASPNCLHEAQSVFFLERGVPVLCEKPAALSPDSLTRIADAARRGGAAFMEAMRPTHDPAVGRIARALGSIAPVRSARLEFSQYSSRYDRFRAGEAVNTFDPAMGNSALADLGVYALAFAALLFGEPDGIGGASAAYLENGFEASGAATLAYAGAVCTASWSKVCAQAAPSVILGERGAITVDRLSEPKDVRIRVGDGGFSPLDVGAAENNMVFEIADFIDAVNGADASAYLEDSMSRARLVAAIAKAQERPHPARPC